MFPDDIRQGNTEIPVLAGPRRLSNFRRMSRLALTLGTTGRVTWKGGNPTKNLHLEAPCTISPGARGLCQDPVLDLSCTRVRVIPGMLWSV